MIQTPPAAPQLKILRIEVVLPDGSLKVIKGPDVLGFDGPKGYMMAKNHDGSHSEYFHLPMVAVTEETRVLVPQ